MELDTVRSLVLVGATLTTGLVAGAFALYAHTVMPALRETDDRTFVEVFQRLDRAILNGWFLAGGFLGALLLTGAAALLSLPTDAAPWVLAALVLYLVAFVVTVAVHVPLNDAIKAAGDPARVADPGGVRRSFGEARWAAWNLVRVAASCAAVLCLAWALVVHGQAS